MTTWPLKEASFVIFREPSTVVVPVNVGDALLALYVSREFNDIS